MCIKQIHHRKNLYDPIASKKTSKLTPKEGLSDDQIKLLDQERHEHLKKKSKSYSWAETKDIIKQRKKP